jgi:flagellar basal-body rod modification protein FlgD
MNIQGFSPAMPAAVQQANTSSASTSSTAGSTSSSTSSSSSSLQTTFLNLLITELQNQDPTSPVDPTAMVGQMISLNQLDQLISINQSLQNLSPSGSSSTGTQSSSASQADASTQATTNQANLNPGITKDTTAAQNAAAAALSALGVSSGSTANTGLMNLYGSLGLPTVNPYPAYTGAK